METSINISIFEFSMLSCSADAVGVYKGILS